MTEKYMATWDDMGQVLTKEFDTLDELRGFISKNLRRRTIVRAWRELVVSNTIYVWCSQPHMTDVMDDEKKTSGKNHIG